MSPNKHEVQKSRRCLTVVDLTRVGFNTLYVVRGQESNPDVITQSPDTLYKVIWTHLCLRPKLALYQVPHIDVIIILFSASRNVKWSFLPFSKRRATSWLLKWYDLRVAYLCQSIKLYYTRVTMVFCIIDESLTVSRVSNNSASTDKPVYHSNGFWRVYWSKIPNAHTSCNAVADLSVLELEHCSSSNRCAQD